MAKWEDAEWAWIEERDRIAKYTENYRDDCEPEVKTFWIWWESDKEWCEDIFDVEADDAEEAREIAQGMIDRGEADVPEDAVITNVSESESLW